MRLQTLSGEDVNVEEPGMIMWIGWLEIVYHVHDVPSEDLQRDMVHFFSRGGYVIICLSCLLHASERDRILTSSSHVGNESGRQGSENRLPLLAKSKQKDIFYF